MAVGSEVSVVVLAAGEGKRLRSKLPKVLHRAAGKPLLVHALAAARAIEPREIVVVASVRKDEIAAEVERFGFEVGYVIQDPPLGTGDAVRVAMTAIENPSTVVITNGDLPLLSADSLAGLLEEKTTSGAEAVMLTTDAPPSSDFGRVIRSPDGMVGRIVEVRDASSAELAVTEVNVGVYAFDGTALNECLQELKPDNSQGEYYLTDVIGLLREQGSVVAARKIDREETLGVNDRMQLSEVTRGLYRRKAEELMAAGVTIVDPATTYIDDGVLVEPDATILPGTFLEGDTRISSGAEVGPNSRVIDSLIGPDAIVTYSVVRGSRIGPAASVGPFASLRPGTELAEGAKIGTFVETKNAIVGPNSKANHLSYLGDAEIGSGVNVGAGTITCNWDGKAKHKTVIEDDAYISSDTMLVAPVRIGKRAATGAGSVVRGDVPDDALAVGVPARIIEGKGNRLEKGE